MVTRKPVGGGAVPPLPYSLSPTRSDTHTEEENVWGSPDLKESGIVQTSQLNNEIPPLLKVGSAIDTPRSSFDSHRGLADEFITPAEPSQDRSPSQTRNNNPFHRKHSSGKEQHRLLDVQDQQNSADIWAELAPVAPKTSTTLKPSVDVSRNTNFEDTTPFAEASKNPFEEPLIQLSEVSQNQEELGRNPWELDTEKNQAHPIAVSAGAVEPDGSPWTGQASSNPNGSGDQQSQPSQSSLPGTSARTHIRPVSPSKQKNQTYQIKHIRWCDNVVTGNIRTSPILVQNANGPCPLLALVNALSLTTPPNTNTALVETLRVREQVSLSLLIDAVFDELMSERRGNASSQLPDIEELHSFLVTLHTGMNVNPRFVRQKSYLLDSKSSETFRPSPGEFEDTIEMRLYKTFQIPLVHGWIPPSSDPAFPALQRSANSYEDAQNLLFKEEELDEKSQRQGLSFEEQNQLEDIASIKLFLSASATQLTGYGLDTITEWLHSPGGVAIFFRNDHFSTIYKHPSTGQLLTLVTDEGYASHDEIVWESLVDVQGEGAEFYSGDFRPVSHSTTNMSGELTDLSTNDGARDWTTVTRNNKGRASNHGPDTTVNPIAAPSTVQEDADLALALQLQEEEDERSRRDGAARRRQQEEEASRAYLTTSNTSANSSNLTTNAERAANLRRPSQPAGPAVPPLSTQNRNRTTSAANVAPPRQPSRPVPITTARNTRTHREQADDGEEAPPSYEQAAKTSPYLGPGSPPASPLINQAGSSRTGLRPRQQSAYSEHLGNTGTAVPGEFPGGADGRPGQKGRRPSGDCGVM